MTAKQWLLKQRNTHILNKVMTSETTVGELMEEFRFESQAHFTHYCKQHFNCTPRELIMKYHIEFGGLFILLQYYFSILF